MTVRSRLVALLVALFTISVSGCSSDGAKPGAEAKTVRFGYIADYNGSSLIALAGKNDLWSKHGLKIEAKPFTNGPLQIQALGAGDLDFGYLGPGALWLPASGKAKIVAINTLGFADRVIAQPGRGITSAADLKGKKVGVPEGTSGDMILALALKKAGMKTSDVQKVTMDPATVVSAFSSGQIDAAGIWYPLIDTIRKQVPDVVELAKNDDFYPETSFPTAFVGRNEVVDTDPDLTVKVVKVLQEANDLRAGNLDESVKITADFLKVPADRLSGEAKNVRALRTEELVAFSEDGGVSKWLAGMNELFVAFGKLPSAPDPATYYSASTYTAAAGR